ncbi:hypothetical protein ASC90_01835 [Rhizobium sp. Root1220]|nr:hypothetical protein ASC90_01835 [Rhizobium sp. Root1220]
MLGLLRPLHRLRRQPPHRLAIAPALLPAGEKWLGAPALPDLGVFVVKGISPSDSGGTSRLAGKLRFEKAK